jgi:diamine N-acetyltransferase
MFGDGGNLPLRLDEAEEGDLSWILNLEDSAARGGFVSGENLARHRMRMNDPTCLYLVAKRGEEQVGYVILRGISGATPVVELKRIVVNRTDAGHGQSVMALLLHKVFGELSAHRVWLEVADNNQRAQHIYRKLGFVEEGRLREAFLTQGQRLDLMLFGLLAREHQAAASSDDE